MREHLYSVYSMASRSGVLYIGVTSDLQTRARQHKAGTFEGFSKKYRCHRLVFYERYDYIQVAIGCEKQLKGFSRKNEDRADRINESALAGFERELGTRAPGSQTVNERSG